MPSCDVKTLTDMSEILPRPLPLQPRFLDCCQEPMQSTPQSIEGSLLQCFSHASAGHEGPAYATFFIKQFFVSWSGVLTLVYTGFPAHVLKIKGNLHGHCIAHEINCGVVFANLVPRCSCGKFSVFTVVFAGTGGCRRQDAGCTPCGTVGSPMLKLLNFQSNNLS